MLKALTSPQWTRSVKHPQQTDGEKTIQVQIEDILRQSEEQGIQRMARMICYNIALHQNPVKLNKDQGLQFVFTMKKLLSAHYLQVRSRP